MTDVEHPGQSPPLPDGGRMTFLFTDIEGSTELWEQHPDMMHQVMVQHDELVESAVRFNQGQVVRPRGEGDSRFAIFPHASDAVAAAAAIQLNLQTESWPIPTPLRVRIGIHTGEAELHQGDYYGETVNRCARIRGVGHGGQTLISATSAALVEKRLPKGGSLRDMGRHRLKGLSQPEHIFQLVVPGLQAEFPPLKSLPAEIPHQPPAFLDSQAETVLVDDGLFVARESELDWLDGSLAGALTGKRHMAGPIAFVTGEAGRGKTSLLEAFSRQAQAHRPDLIVARGISDMYKGVGDPFLPFRDVLNMLTGDVENLWQVGAISRDHALRLWRLLPHSVQALTTVGEQLIGTLVSGKAIVNRASVYSDGKMDGLGRLREITRHKEMSGGGQIPDQSHLFEAYTAVLSALAAHRPLLLILDDLHWADLSSIGLLGHLGRRLVGSPILIVGAYRPEDVALGREGERHPLTTILSEFKRQLGNIWLDLDQGALDKARDFINALLDAEPNRLDEDFRRALVTHTRGQPLFTIELLRDMRERGDLRRDDTGHWIAGSNLHLDLLPPRVEGVIETRIERLDPDLREILSVASVEGESFTAEVVAGVLDIEERELISRISRELDKKHHLVKGQGVRRLGIQRVSQYRFRHNLIQLYLYKSLDAVELQYLHEAVGNELESLYGYQIEDVAIELARHFEQAGLAAKAAEYLYQAGSRAVRIPANEEAIDQFERGLSLLESLPETAERDRQELSLQIALFAPLAAAKGYGVPEVGRAYTRARELCEKIDDPDQLFLVLYGLWGHNLVRSELLTSRTLAAECLVLAKQEGKVAFLMEAHRMTDESAFYMGEFGRAREHFQQSIALYDPQEHGAHAEIYGQDPGVALLSHGCCILWHFGLPEQALGRSQQAIALAKEQKHPFSLGFALCYSAMMHQYRREPDAVLELAEAAIKLSREKGFAIWLAQARFFQGWGLAEQGKTAEGIIMMEQGLADWRATGTEFLTAYTSALLAAAKAKIGQVNEGLALLEDALADVNEKSQGLYEAELHRLKGALLLQKGTAVKEVEGYFQQAIKVARRRQALSQELRSVMALCQVWQRQGKSAEAHAALSEIYGRFEEGFDTADLQEASELLEDVAAELT